jgi:hypothetical protein
LRNVSKNKNLNLVMTSSGILYALVLSACYVTYKKISSLKWKSWHWVQVVNRLRGCSYDPTYRDVLPTETNISVRLIWNISSRLLRWNYNAKLLHFSQATQILSDFSVFLRLFTRKSIALVAYLILVYKTNIKPSKKC